MKKSVAPLLFLVPALLGTSALAYILPGSSILRRMVEAQGQTRLVGLRVEGTVAFLNSAAAQAAPLFGQPSERTEIQTDAVLALKFPGRCRLETTAPDAGTIAVAQSYKKVSTQGAELPSMAAALSQLCPILVSRAGSQAEARAVVERHLRSLGVDVTKTALERFSGKVVYVLGDPAPDRPQFWVYKESFLPARVVFNDTDGVRWDVKFVDYSSPVTGEGFPRVVEVSKNDERVLRFTGLRADTRANLPDKLFQ